MKTPYYANTGIYETSYIYNDINPLHGTYYEENINNVLGKRSEPDSYEIPSSEGNTIVDLPGRPKRRRY